MLSRSPSGLVLAFALLGAPLGCGSSDPAATTPAAATAPARVDSATAHAAVQRGALLLDVRTPKEFAEGHVDGATNIPVEDLDARIAEVASAKEIVVYCHSGRRSAIAAGKLRAAGHTVLDLGPMKAW